MLARRVVIRGEPAERLTDHHQQHDAPVRRRRRLLHRDPQPVRTAHRFEGGNPNFLGLHVLRRSAALIAGISLPAIEARVRDLTTQCMAMIRSAGLTTLTPEPWAERAQIVSVPVPDAGALMDRLREKHRVIVNVKDGALRISMGFANNEEDLERAVAAIRQELAA